MSMITRRRRWRRFTAAIAAAAFVALSASTVAPAVAAPAAPIVVEMTPALKAKIQALIDDFRTSHSISGISAAVVTPDPHGPNPVITTFASGEPSFGSGTQVDASTQFELGSETKAFTADLLAYLVASNVVSLDDPVQMYAPVGITVPEWIDPDSGIHTPITLRDLATHQAGLPDPPWNFTEGCGGPPSCENPRPGYTQTMLWSGLESQLLLWQPGTRWLYSNWGFGLLSTILSNVVNSVPITDPPAYQLTIEQAFLDDLGMSSTELEPPSPPIATPYYSTGAPAFYWDNTNAISGAGGLISNANDMGTWVAAHLGYNTAGASLGVRSMANTLLPVSTITTECSSDSQCGPADFQMGLAWQLYSATHADMGAPWAFKNGGTAGSSTDTVMASSLGLGVTTMFNQERNNNDEVAAVILRLLIAQTKLADTGSATSWLGATALGAAALLGLGIALATDRRRRIGRTGR